MIFFVETFRVSQAILSPIPTKKINYQVSINMLFFYLAIITDLSCMCKVLLWRLLNIETHKLLRTTYFQSQTTPFNIIWCCYDNQLTKKKGHLFINLKCDLVNRTSVF